MPRWRSHTGADGVVFGVLTADGLVDIARARSGSAT